MDELTEYLAGCANDGFWDQVQAESRQVAEGEPVLLLHADAEARLAGALAALEGAVEVGPEPPAPRPLVHERIG